MFFASADGADAVTVGLGVIAAALFFGEFAFFKWIHGPALDRADRLLTSVEARHKEELKEARDVIRRLEEKNDKQSLVLEDKALPALIAATTTVTQIRQYVEELKLEQASMVRERELENARQKALKERSGG